MTDLASTFRDLVSGKRRGIGATLARGALRVAEVPYSFAVRRRNRQFDSGSRPIERAAVPVISVGNITLGGTGKTPMVEWVCRQLRDRGLRVAIVSRGYGKRDGAANDEALELAQKLPDVLHVQNPDRVAAAIAAIEASKCQAIVLDDAFQHRRIARDLDIVLLDSQEPFGFDHVFPRGTLREPLSGLSRADCVVLSRADMIVPENRMRIRQGALCLAPRALWAECVHAPIVLVTASGAEVPLDALRGRRVAAFCGIGNPAGFRHTLASCGYEVSLFREFADHHAYRQTDVESLIDWADQAEVSAVICTHKDLVKISLDQLGDKPLYALRVGMEFLVGQTELEARLSQILLARSRGEETCKS
ncbi:MAG TPA: tetraacyldisaccharide 4'-kinase [Pirellulales bacterium]|nr:tetraacyldisaccharide 4'-kinase [Pirellulales bacterium]